MYIDKRIYRGNWDEIKDILPDITKIKSLNLRNMGLTEFPKMSHITINGYFNCSYNQLKSFNDSPVVKGNFYCYDNKITSFKDCPDIGGYLFSDVHIFNIIHRYSKNKKFSLLEAQVELYNKQDEKILEHIDKFPDLVAYIRMKELSKLLCA